MKVKVYNTYDNDIYNDIEKITHRQMYKQFHEPPNF